MRWGPSYLVLWALGAALGLYREGPWAWGDTPSLAVERCMLLTQGLLLGSWRPCVFVGIVAASSRGATVLMPLRRTPLRAEGEEGGEEDGSEDMME